MGTLRWYQDEAVESVQERLHGTHSTLAVLATGLGKTQCFAELAHRTSGDILVLAHREELVDQAVARIAEHTGEYVEAEQADRRSRMSTRIVVGSVQTLANKLRRERLGLDRFSLVIQDECFPAGTPIATPAGTVPIEQIQPGDGVMSVADNGCACIRRVIRTFRSKPKAMLTLFTSVGKITVTAGHPFLTPEGWCRVIDLPIGAMVCYSSTHHEQFPADMRRVREGLQSPIEPHEADLWAEVPKCSAVSDHGEYESQTCLRENEAQEPHALRRCPGEDAAIVESYWAQACSPGRQWARSDHVRAGFGECPWLGAGNHRENPHWPRFWISEPLQAGSGKQGADGGDRSGRGEPWRIREKTPGPKEGGVLAWARVEGIEVNEPSGERGFERVCPGGEVFNFEVEGTHNYIADGFLVHNCHHYLAKTYRQVVESFSGKRVGFTATPDRSDKKGLATLFESVAYNMGILEGIEHGYLVPIIGEHVELGEVDLSGVERQQGDLVASQLDDVMVKAVEGIVKKTLELHPEKRAIGFFPGLKSAEYATERINALEPGSTCFVSSKTDPEKRRELVLAFRQGQFKRMFNVGIFTEGADFPDVSLIIGARPTMSRSLWAQMAGRGTRTLPGIADAVPEREGGSARRRLVAESAKPSVCILDFVGNAGRHRLVGPEDVLGESYSEEERRLSRKVAKERPGMDVLESLAEARERLAEAARRLRSRVSAKVTRFDPFEGMGGSEGERVAERDARFGAKPITSGQLQALMNLGMLRPEAEKLSQRQAKKMLEMLRERSKNKLSTYRQNRRLKQLGIPDLSKMTFEAASKIIGHRGQIEIDMKARRVRLLKGVG